MGTAYLLMTQVGTPMAPGAHPAAMIEEVTSREGPAGAEALGLTGTLTGGESPLIFLNFPPISFRSRGGEGGGVNPGNNLHVSSLSHRVDTRDLEAAFAKIGRVSLDLLTLKTLALKQVVPIGQKGICYVRSVYPRVPRFRVRDYGDGRGGRCCHYRSSWHRPHGQGNQCRKGVYRCRM